MFISYALENPGMPGPFFQRKLLVSDPGMHHGTCVTHVPWCMSGSLTGGGGENIPGIPGACATRNFKYLARGPYIIPHVTCNRRISRLSTNICPMCQTKRVVIILDHLQFSIQPGSNIWGEWKHYRRIWSHFLTKCICIAGTCFFCVILILKLMINQN